MSSIPLHYVDLRAFCYATEDDKRVEQALRLFLPEDVELDRVETAGHYGDRILIYSVRVERADEIRHVLTQLASLPALTQVIDELDDRVTDNTELFLTLDKQAAFNGTVSRGDGITFRGKLEAYPATREAAIENARDILTDLDESE
ncbi:hypothetical protein C479_01271 [Halovivax asiaticus JCM 14624]|uniref:Exosome subunit n=1 Tax=Halovivax asiaticus JCM 14624 TaxID=1227490 RepID=M0BSQ2_9EURY|nr:RNA-binding protein [Halovivax asiaticus]ELZ13433.1 hypothetical protein C479_01271 [Halovivax asiaticus JCM 14624]